MHIVSCIAQPVIEGQHSCIVLAHAKTDFWTTKINQICLGACHDMRPKAAALPGLCNSQIVDRPAMPVITDHHSCDNAAISIFCHPECAIPVGQLARDVLQRVIP